MLVAVGLIWVVFHRRISDHHRAQNDGHHAAGGLYDGGLVVGGLALIAVGIGLVVTNV